MRLSVQTSDSHQAVDITDLVEKQLAKDAKAVGIHVAHTTCAVTTADLDPGAGEDMMEAIWQMIPKLDFKRHHDPAHFPAHIAASIIGPGVTIPVEEGKLALGSWQRIILAEFDGPRPRQIHLTLL